ncbi:MAG: SRPBCC family protein [Saprospiraceae bacterium]
MASDRILKKTILIQATTAQVWNALTNPEKIKEWLYGTNVKSDWKVGSSIIFTGNWEGTEYIDKGTILKFEIEKVLQYNYWSSFSGLTDSAENYSVLSFILKQSDNATELTLEQSNFATEIMYEHSDKNWDSTLDLLKKVVEN